MIFSLIGGGGQDEVGATPTSVGPPATDTRRNECRVY